MIIDFNRDWEFYKYNEESNKKIINLPHDAMIVEERKKCLNGTNSGYFPGGRYIYSKEFEIKEENIGKYISIFFEGVYRNATIYLNEEKIYFHAYGYTEFEVNISSKVKVGVNKIKVDVDNTLEPNSRWYSGSGIYRKVSLIIKDQNYIKNLKVITKSINPATINIGVDNKDAIVEIYDGKILKLSGKPGDFVIDDAKLWDDINPNLYRIVVKNSVDEVEINYGIRELKRSPKTGVTINGREVKFRGTCIHHDNGVIGAVELKDASDRRIRILKEQGYNAIRSAHNPCSREILNACNKYGMYVMDESFDMWYIPKTYHDYSRDFYENYKQDIESMVKKDFNYSCVVMYSLGNENSEPCEEKGMNLVKEQADLFKKFDSTRIVTIGANLMIMGGTKIYKETKNYERKPLSEKESKDIMSSLEKAGSTGFNFAMGLVPGIMTKMVKGKKYGVLTDKLSKRLDIVGLNYGYVRYEHDIKRNPNIMFVGSETFNHQIVKNWELVKKYHQVVGDFCWTAWDYLGEAASCGAFDYFKWSGLSILDGVGAIDFIGNPTPVNYYMQIEYGTYTKPYIAVSTVNYYKEKYLKGGWRMNNYLHSWSFKGYEGTPAIVEVYSKCDHVVLSLNNKAIATKKSKENIAKFKIKYNSGILKAECYDHNNMKLGEDVLKTAEEETFIKLKVDKTNLASNGKDLCYLNIDLIDKNGEIKVTNEDEIIIDVNGDAAYLAGFGSARSKIEGSYNENKFNAHFGRALAIFRASYHTGDIEITVSVNGLESKKIKISVK